MYVGLNGLKELGCNYEGRDFIVSDLHGCYTQLIEELDKVLFDNTKDRLICVGDLIDRGPESIDCLKLITKPWFHTVLGNHEVMMLRDDPMWTLNGGNWALEEDFALLDHYRDLIKELPYAIQVTRKDNKNIGVVHAEPEDDWNNITNWLKERITWYRNKVRIENVQLVKNIDLVVCGHTPLKEPVLKANIYWIDTGAFMKEWAKNNEAYKDRSGRLTLINIDDLPV